MYSIPNPPIPQQLDRLESILKKDSLYRPTPDEHEFMWEFRHFLRNKPQALAKLLTGVEWNEPAAVAEAIRTLGHWVPLLPVDALELLDAKFGCPEVQPTLIFFQIY